ncbi:DEAD/DEAH box helicase [Alicyclobacillus fastidiosus]|uniref:DEAD/DEAH box helicase family protein n=1 Tax=Alicyclobacillus fastidiosus TaxID=392011 RepID=A0ABV5AGA7_9BACL|nr:DEAD/DEAH box helicase family protein [Alicyclobacillus fastidiosus]WEH09748.1 DEAD/DEAH box helicase family protein [Alicyclobacillus fastidiosus]
MAVVKLFDFQQEAVNRLLESAIDYFKSGPDRLEGRNVPYVGQLKAVTGARKTPIMAKLIGQLGPCIVLWTTKFGSVVDQTVANLRSGGKYHQLFGTSQIEVIKFTEIPSYEQWRDILDRSQGITVLVSTVAAWNSTEKDDRLNVHRVSQDWGNVSRWEQLRTHRSRPLWVVYDEAHNSTSDQVELLDELEPSGFFVASASPVQGKLHKYLTTLSDETRRRRIVPVSTREVVEAELLKSTISLADYESSAEDMIGDVVARRGELEKKLVLQQSSTVPKAIYVVEASNSKGTESRPVYIWRTLIKLGVSPREIAICTNTKDLPKDAIRVNSVNQLSDEFTHIIFNKKLQEGWDDPSVYLCYFDGKTGSAVRIQQVIGRALRQPGAKHLQDEDLNTAFFFVHCPTDLL